MYIKRAINKGWMCRHMPEPTEHSFAQERANTGSFFIRQYRLSLAAALPTLL
jgi:hypothetical protein